MRGSTGDHDATRTIPGPALNRLLRKWRAIRQRGHLSTRVQERRSPALNAGGTSGRLIQAYNTGASAYNSLQVSLNHQFARNFVGQFNYTWSHCIDNGSFASSLEEFAQLVEDRYNQKYSFGNCTFDIRHNISANVLYSLPFKGNRLIEGWQISSIVGIHTGLPLNVYNNAVFTDPADLGSQWGTNANYTFAPGCTPRVTTSSSRGSSTQSVATTGIQWFDPACYEAQAPGFLGNVKRDSIPGPGALSADISVTKNTQVITEETERTVPRGVFQLRQSLQRRRDGSGHPRRNQCTWRYHGANHVLAVAGCNATADSICSEV